MKVIAAHPAQQHSYRTAAALKRAGVLDKYITTVYYRPRSLTRLVSKILRGRFRTKAMARHCDDIADDEVIQFCEAEGLFKLLALNTRFFRKHYYGIKYHTADRFAKKVAAYAIRSHADAVITYDDCSPLLFEILQEKAPQIIRIMDMSSANLLYLREIYESDLKISPRFADRLRRERSICWDPAVLDRARREIASTQKFLVPSDFVARSLEFSGVKPDQMYKCPYGVDVSLFAPEVPGGRSLPERPVRFIYVGGVKELKGISYLLEAINEIPSSDAELTVVGSYNGSDEDIQPYKDRVRFTGTILHSAVADELRYSDVFVFASLGEGLSLSVLEAAACGLPLIVTENSGVNDEMTDGVEGFVVPIQSKEALKDRMMWFIDHPESIRPMGEAARRLALKFTWNDYCGRLGEIVGDLV